MRVIHREIVGGFIFSNDGHMLLGKSKPGGVYPGYMLVPGGGVDEGETKQDAIKREVLEEVGIDISDAKVELLNDALSGESEKVLRSTGERVLVRCTSTTSLLSYRSQRPRLQSKPMTTLPMLFGYQPPTSQNSS